MAIAVKTIDPVRYEIFAHRLWAVGEEGRLTLQRTTASPIVAQGGECPQCANGSISPAAFDGHTLYVGGGQARIGSTTCKGDLLALNPATAANARIVDLERETLGGPYDAVFANDVLHHITNLEGLYGRIHEALSPEGKLFFCEYVGPNRFQYSDERMELVNRYLRVLPDRLRLDPLTGESLWRRERLSAEKVEQDDPTEAVRSRDVLPLARQAFRAEAEYPSGGGLLNPLLFGLIANFREGAPEDDGLLRLLCDAEDRLTRSRRLEPDFLVFAGRRRN